MDRQRKTVSQDTIRPTQQTRSQRWLWKLFIVFLCAGGIFIFAAVTFRLPTSQKQNEQTLDGSLIVLVRTSERGVESIPIEKAGALPVRANGIMSLEANFSQPACAYFVWFDCEGRWLPLYPWNYDTLEMTDIPMFLLEPLQPSAKLSAEWFTGTVRNDSQFSRHSPERGVGASVTFKPGSRTLLHTHPQRIRCTYFLTWYKPLSGDDARMMVSLLHRSFHT